MKWQTKELPEVVFFQEGPGVRKWQFKETGIKLINGGNINEGLIDLSSTKIYISEEEAYGKYKHFMIDEGDLVIASSGVLVDNFHNKIAFIEKKHLPLCMNTSTIRFKTLDKKTLNMNYFRFFLKTNIFKSQIRKLITGSAQLNFGPSHLKKIKIPLPPIAEQIRIADVLSRAESLIAKRKETIKMLDEYLKSVFLDMFGDPQSNEIKFNLKRISDVCKEIVDCVNKTAPNEEEKTPYIMVRTSNIRNGTISLENIKYVNEKTYKIWTRRSVPLKNDILFTREAPLGEVGIIDFNDNIFLGQRIMCYRFDTNKANPIFMLYFMQTRYFKNQIAKLGKGSTVKHLSVPDCYKIKVFVPEIEMQNNFCNIVNKVEILKSFCNKYLLESIILQNTLNNLIFNIC
ncbi:MAG: restriction endonuclease subunit S [Candidatus Goldbacteria bacterium]|nr:restriction endonuclease subunit S [Candidatus Goldiibacteriota bacterium]